MLQVKNLCLSFGQKAIFDQISFNIACDQRIGLIGRNGAGKTTLFKIIAGLSGFDSGSVEIQGGFKISYMAQEVVLLSERSILHEALAAFGDLISKFEELEQLEQRLDQAALYHDDELVNRYSILQNYLAEYGFKEKLFEAKKILIGLGFKVEDLGNPVNSLSVGWKMRLVLAKLLLEKADFYLFDEPINHLDLIAKDWFFQFIKNSKFGFLLICHDSYFLDGLCNQIFDLSNAKIKQYNGNYHDFLEQKAATEQLTEKKYVEQQKMLKKRTQVIERFRASATKAKMAQSMIKSLEKVELVEFEKKSKSINFDFSQVERAGRIVLDCRKLSKTFDDHKIFENVTFQLERGRKAAIVAQNGVGKTTLLNLITGKYPLNSGGEIEFGHKVKCAIFEQDQNRSLNMGKTVLEEVEDSCTNSEQRARVRTALGSFLFSGDDVYKKISVLSGGEKNRVAMVKVLLQEANFLILDEPTNHLDIESKEILLKVLKSYSGTILFVSHDRNFLNDLATDVFELTPNGIAHYFGNYDSFLYQKEQAKMLLEPKNEKKVGKQAPSPAQTQKNSPNYENAKKMRNLESKISRLEREKERLEHNFGSLDYGSAEYQKNEFDLKNIKKELEQTYQAYILLENE